MPFIVFGLPRSRTAWLATFLSQGGPEVGHDIGIEADTFADVLDQLHSLPGTVETGSMCAWRLLKHAMPGLRMVTIRRPPDDVLKSLAAIGVTGVDDEIHARNRLLDEMEAAGVPRVDYGALQDPRVCGALFELLTGRRFDFHEWSRLDQTDVQLDLEERFTRLAARDTAIETLTAEVSALTAQLDGPSPPQFVRITREPFPTFWRDAAALATAHHAEANADRTPFRLNTDMLTQLEAAGAFRVYTARVNGVLAGYCTWSLSPNLESEGVLLADQGALYSDPAYSRLQLGRRVLDFAIPDLKQAGVHCLQFHHPVIGRGRKLAALFKRLGAVLHQLRYILWIA